MLSKIIKLFHLLILILVLISPFLKNKFIKKQIIFLLLYISFRNLSGYRKCGLTQIESKLSRKPIESGFIYNIIKPYTFLDKYSFYKLILPIQYWILLILIFQKFYYEKI